MVRNGLWVPLLGIVAFKKKDISSVLIYNNDIRF